MKFALGVFCLRIRRYTISVVPSFKLLIHVEKLPSTNRNSDFLKASESGMCPFDFEKVDFLNASESGFVFFSRLFGFKRGIPSKNIR